MTRLRLYRDKSTINVPSKLMNTATSPQQLGLEYASLIRNLVPSGAKEGILEKRYGTAKVGTSLVGNILRQFYFTKDDGTVQLLVATDDGKLLYSNDYGTTWIEIKAGLSSTGSVNFIRHSGSLLIYNGIDNNMIWNGTTLSTLEEEVEEQLPIDWKAKNRFDVSTAFDLSSRYQVNDTLTMEVRGTNLQVASITLSGSVATTTTTIAHNLTTGDAVTIAGATEVEYNGRYEITVVSTTVFTYVVVGTPASPATILGASIKTVKGDSKPTYAYAEIPVTIAGLIGDNDDNPQVLSKDGNEIGQVDSRYSYYRTPTGATGFKIHVGIQPEGHRYSQARPKAISVFVLFREVGTTDWIRANNSARIARQKKDLIIEVDGFDHKEIEVVVIGQIGFDAVWLKVNKFFYKRPFGAEIVSAGNRFDETSIINVSSITRAANVATATTAVGHGYVVDDAITVFDVEEPEYNGTFLVTAVTATTFTYEVAGDPASPATINSLLPTYIQYGIEKKEVTATILTSTYNAGTDSQELVFTTDILPSVSIDISELMYIHTVIPFSFMTSINDRVWALSGGELKANTYRGANGTKIYYTVFANNELSWVDNETQEEAYLDIEDKHKVQDELVGISAIEGQYVFHGRRAMQIWGGYSPSEMRHSKTIQVGTVHGDLIQTLPNDVMFVSTYGVRSVRNADATENLEISPELGDAIDPTIQDMVTEILTSDAKYKSARSYRYDKGGFYGFNFGGKHMLFTITEKIKGWVEVSGDLLASTDFVDLPDNRLLLNNGTDILEYSNGVNNDKAYTDRGVQIPVIWSMPWIVLKNKRYANRYWEITLGADTAATDLVIKRFKNLDDSSIKGFELAIDSTTSFWDEALWDAASWKSQPVRYRKRDKFICDSYRVILSSSSADGKFEIINIKVIGS